MSLLRKSGSTVVAFIVKELIGYASQKSELPFVVSPGLDYVEAQESLRSTLNENERHVSDADDVADAFVAWQRTVLKWSEAEKFVGDTTECDFLGRGAFGQFEMNFKLFSSSMALLEQFEVAYVTRTLFSDIDNIGVLFKGCDDSKCAIAYTLDWSDLEGLEHSKADNHYSSLGFTVTVSGSFMSLLNDADKLIAEATRPTPILEIVFDTVIEASSKNYST
jgi:hypothetical protein